MYMYTKSSSNTNVKQGTWGYSYGYDV